MSSADLPAVVPQESKIPDVTESRNLPSLTDLTGQELLVAAAKHIPTSGGDIRYLMKANEGIRLQMLEAGTDNGQGADDISDIKKVGLYNEAYGRLSENLRNIAIALVNDDGEVSMGEALDFIGRRNDDKSTPTLRVAINPWIARFNKSNFQTEGGFRKWEVVNEQVKSTTEAMKDAPTAKDLFEIVTRELNKVMDLYEKESGNTEVDREDLLDLPVFYAQQIIRRTTGLGALRSIPMDREDLRNDNVPNETLGLLTDSIHRIMPLLYEYNLRFLELGDDVIDTNRLEDPGLKREPLSDGENNELASLTSGE